MDELLQKLQSLHGLTAEQSRGILGTITAHIKEKFPMVAGAIDNLFPQGTTSPSTSGANAGDQATAGTSSQGSGDILDKISGIIPGAAGEKIEEFAKSKLGSLFGGNKSA
jgi:hypothetical protein